MSSCVVFPSFAVIDGSWGPCWLNISNVHGLMIESKESGHILENWQWNQTSHVTIKKASTLLVQAKKFNGVKKLITFANLAELERFKRVLNNAVPILTVYNIRRQRKFVIIQAPPQALPTSVGSIYVEAAKTIITDINSNVQVTGASGVPPPPPPPPPSMMPKIKVCIKPKNASNKLVAQKDSALNEMKIGFANGILNPSQIKRARIEKIGTKSPTEVIPKSELVPKSER